MGAHPPPVKVVDGLNLTNSDNGLCTLTLNNPRRRNACNVAMYGCIGDMVTHVSTDPSVKVLYITGEGEYFTSGNDLSPKDPSTMPSDPTDVFRCMVNAFINCPKLIVVGVNGPAIGFGVTLLGLVDLVYATDTATFQTPFVTLGLCPEGCSSVVFPQLMGRAKATEILVAGRKLNAQEAYERNLITEVLPTNEFRAAVSAKIEALCQLPRESLACAKGLIVGPQREMLMRVNEVECERLRERTSSEEFMNTVIAFMNAKIAKKKMKSKL